ncbi:MAG: response regulator transcription factor [Defluviitaleaceae bacterium]|nr:response regulator transcription factor [Defluviitaleaceae bacterium]
MRILLVEDDDSLRAGLEFILSKDGHETKRADTVCGALFLLTENDFDMALLDVALPDGSGLDICGHIRRTSPATHVLLLTAKDTETDIVVGYETGADDYLTKPFGVSVLKGKVNAAARRIAKTTEANVKTNVKVCEIMLDAANQAAAVRGTAVSLTRNEFRLLSAFIKNPGQVLSKETLLHTLWDIDGDFVDENTLAVNIRRLREKIELDPSRPVVIETVRGAGYRMKADG